MNRKLIGLYQLITGIFGVVAIILNVTNGFSADELSSGILSMYIIGAIMFGFLAYSGNALYYKKKNGLEYSKILQWMQVLSFTIGGFMYKFTSAAFLSVGYNGKFAFEVSPKVADFTIYNIGAANFSFSIYLLPIIILVGLYRLSD